MKDDFLTIPDAPNYEINSEFIVRKKSNGKILKSYKRPDRNAIVVTLRDDKGKQIKRDIKTFRRQAQTAAKENYLDWWVKLPSLNYLYEINPSGVLRNAITKKIKKKIRIKNSFSYVVSIDNKSVYANIKSLLWEAHGIINYKPHPPIPNTISDGVSSFHFDSLKSTATFLSKIVYRAVGTIHNLLTNKRPDEIYGWKITYFPPENLADVVVDTQALLHQYKDSRMKIFK